MGGFAAVIFAAPFVAVILSLLYLLRRERLRGEASTTHPILIGFYKGLAVILLVLFGLPLLVGLATSTWHAISGGR